MAEKAWYYLTDDGNAQGPFDVQTMKELFKGEYVTENAMVWADGEPEWMPLKMSHALYAALVFQDAEKGKKAAPKDADLADFEAEIAAIESSAPEVESPPLDEREFEDDDGTKFVWDSALRKFKPEGVELPTSSAPAAVITTALEGALAAAGATPAGAAHASAAGEAAPGPEVATASVAYTEDMMVFDVEEEVVPTIQQALETERQALEREQEAAATAGKAKVRPAKGAKAESALKVQAAAEGASAETAEAAPAAAGKRKAEGDENSDVKKAKKGEGKKQDATWFDLKTNTSVYVTGIPADATVDEIAEEFGRCGIIKLDDDKKPRIKIYRDKHGAAKGDCLVTYLQQPSVKLALTVMDGRELRPGTMHDGKLLHMTVQEAQFQQKGDFVPKANPSKKAKRKKVIEQQERLLGWQGFDDVHKPSEVTVILSSMFTTEEMTLNPQLAAELEADVLSECKQFGAIDKLQVFPANPDGVVSVKFRTPDAAQGCIALMHGRFFAGRQMGKRGITEAREHERKLTKSRPLDLKHSVKSWKSNDLSV